MSLLMMTTLTSNFLYANVCCEALDHLREIVRSIERGVQPHVTLTGSLRNALLRYFYNIFLLIMMNWIGTDNDNDEIEIGASTFFVFR